MSHVIVKLWPGKSRDQKTRLADKIVKDVMDVLNYGEESVLVGFEKVQSNIQDKKDHIYKQPGYEMGSAATNHMKGGL